MPLYNIDPAEHTTIERETIIERDSWYSEPWAVALILGAVAIIGLVAYWALYTPQTPAVVSNTTIERPATSGRAERFQNSSPSVVVTPAPQVTVTPPPTSTSSTSGANPPAPANSTPPVIINNQAGQTPSNQTPPNSGDQSSAGQGGANNTTSGN